MEYLARRGSRASCSARSPSRSSTCRSRTSSRSCRRLRPGLHYAHERRATDKKKLEIVHRDVTPSNIIIGYDGSVKLVDFGIAKATMRSADTRTGTLKGKTSYMSPGAVQRRATIDRRSDVYSLGVVLYELATTTRLFKGDSDYLIMDAIVNGKVPLPRVRRPDLPNELSSIIMRRSRSIRTAGSRPPIRCGRRSINSRSTRTCGVDLADRVLHEEDVRRQSPSRGWTPACVERSSRTSWNDSRSSHDIPCTNSRRARVTSRPRHRSRAASRRGQLAGVVYGHRARQHHDRRDRESHADARGLGAAARTRCRPRRRRTSLVTRRRLLIAAPIAVALGRHRRLAPRGEAAATWRAPSRRPTRCRARRRRAARAACEDRARWRGRQPVTPPPSAPSDRATGCERRVRRPKRKRRRVRPPLG